MGFPGFLAGKKPPPGWRLSLSGWRAGAIRLPVAAVFLFLNCSGSREPRRAAMRSSAVDYSNLSSLSTAALWAATFAFGLVSGIIPFVLNIELYLLAVAALTDASAVPTVGLATAGQTLAKVILYLVGKGALNIRWVKKSAASKAADAFSSGPAAGWVSWRSARSSGSRRSTASPSSPARSGFPPSPSP